MSQSSSPHHDVDAATCSQLDSLNAAPPATTCVSVESPMLVSTTQPVEPDSSASNPDQNRHGRISHSFGGRLANRFITGIDGAYRLIAGDGLSQLWVRHDVLAEVLGLQPNVLLAFIATVPGMDGQAWSMANHSDSRIDAIRTIVALNIKESFHNDHPEYNWGRTSFPYTSFEKAPVDGSALIRIALDLLHLQSTYAKAIPELDRFLNTGAPNSRRGKTGPIPLTDAIIAHAVRLVATIQAWTNKRFDGRMHAIWYAKRRI